MSTPPTRFDQNSEEQRIYYVSSNAKKRAVTCKGEMQSIQQYIV